MRYGLAVRLPMLSTPPRGDAVSVGYRPENVYLKRTFTSQSKPTCKRTNALAPRVLVWRVRCGVGGCIGCRAAQDNSAERVEYCGAFAPRVPSWFQLAERVDHCRADHLGPTLAKGVAPFLRHFPRISEIVSRRCRLGFLADSADFEDRGGCNATGTGGAEATPGQSRPNLLASRIASCPAPTPSVS